MVKGLGHAWTSCRGSCQSRQFGRFELEMLREADRAAYDLFVTWLWTSAKMQNASILLYMVFLFFPPWPCGSSEYISVYIVSFYQNVSNSRLRQSFMNFPRVCLISSCFTIRIDDTRQYLEGNDKLRDRWTHASFEIVLRISVVVMLSLGSFSTCSCLMPLCWSSESIGNRKHRAGEHGMK